MSVLVNVAALKDRTREDSAVMGLSRTQQAAVLLLIVILACFLRCDRLALPQLSADESFSWRMTTYSPAELLRHVSGDAHPPLYYLLLNRWTALFGDSPFALRILSVFFSLASIVVLYALCREAAARFPSAAGSPFTGMSGAFFAAFLLAIHIGPDYEPSRNARMYIQGIFLAGLSSWLLLRALRCSERFLGWWLGYGLTVAAFCYTHYYAFFTVAAQTLFVFGDLSVRAFLVPTQSVGTRVAASLRGFLLAGTFAFLLFIPWLPVWWKQTHEVWQGFWIPPVTVERATEAFFSWSSGLPYQGAVDFTCWTLFLLACIVWMVGKADRGGLFLLMNSGIPWALALMLSAWGGRPILQERYLLFAQFFLFAFWGVVWDRLPGLVPRLGLGCFLVALSVSGLWTARERWPTRPPALAGAAAFLRDHYQDGDMVLTNGPSSLNRLRYYAVQAGMPTTQTRCLISPFLPPGHINHLASLQAEDIVWNGFAAEPYTSRRVWTLAAANTNLPLPGDRWRESSRWSFGEEGEGQYHLILYERFDRS